MNPTTSGITVCWVSGAAAKGTVTVDAGGPSASDEQETIYHRVKLTGLKPYTHYGFKVMCEGESKTGRFVTAPLPGHPFRFAAYGDNRTQANVHASVLEQMSKFDPDFILQSGDIVQNGEIELQWDEFWLTAGKMLSQTAYYPSLGNHERHGAPYFKYFDLPNEYSFDYGDVHFVALDSNRPPAEYSDQQEWLRKDLSNHQSAKWRIVFFHHTVHTCVDNPGRRAESALRAKRLGPIFAAGNVQLVINGHDHNYQRHISNGITYIVSGGGGAPLYSVTPDTLFAIRAKAAHHHCEMTVDGDAIAVRVVEPGGVIIEQFTIRSKVTVL
jgi:3',5'-cyclic AMP phosphodiesterase CpdA